MMEFLDSHCHLDFEPLKNELEAVVERAYKSRVTKLINVGATLRGSQASVDIANLYPNIWASVGLHPHEAEMIMNIDETMDNLRSLAASDKVVALGEIGLDYFNLEYDDLKAKQRKLFESQLELAIELNLPVIIHTREAEKDTLEILNTKYKHLNTKRGVVHCFTGSPNFAKKLIELGFYIGFTGFVTFEGEKFDHIRESAKVVPLEKIMIETDAPFLAPEPFRGKQNEPAYVVEVAKKLAELKNEALEKIAETTYKNAKRLFNIR